jgi:hypothetical protein
VSGDLGWPCGQPVRQAGRPGEFVSVCNPGEAMGSIGARPRASLIASLAIFVVVAALGSAASGTSSARSREYRLPSDGWKPGEPSQLALALGPFHAKLTASGAQAWIGNSEIPTLWPDGYRVRFSPTELINANGSVIAHAGQWISAAAGASPSNRAHATWDIQSDPIQTRQTHCTHHHLVC